MRIAKLEKKLWGIDGSAEAQRCHASYSIAGWAAEYRNLHSPADNATKLGAMYMTTMEKGEPDVVGDTIPPSWLAHLAGQAAYVRERMATYLSGEPSRIVATYEAELERQYGQIERQWHSIAHRADELEKQYAKRYEEAAARLLREMGMESWECLPSRWEPFGDRYLGAQTNQ